MDANLELQELKTRLLAAGYETEEVREICAQAAVEIGHRIADAVADAMAQAESMGQEAGSQDFLAELTAVPAGDYFIITTDSGKTDWSEPPFPMLPALLKNAKISKDGSQYKHIPVSDKPKSRANSSEEATKARQDHLVAARERLNDSLATSAGGMVDVMTPAHSYIQAYRGARPSSRAAKQKQSSTVTGNVEIRTASSKQNPTTQWVRPGKDFDATAGLSSINANLQAAIDDVISSTLAKYGG